MAGPAGVAVWCERPCWSWVGRCPPCRSGLCWQRANEQAPGAGPGLCCSCYSTAEAPPRACARGSEWSRGESNPRVEQSADRFYVRSTMICVRSRHALGRLARFLSPDDSSRSYSGEPSEHQPVVFVTARPRAELRRTCYLKIRQRERSCYWQLFLCMVFTWPPCSTARDDQRHMFGRIHIGPGCQRNQR